MTGNIKELFFKALYKSIDCDNMFYLRNKKMNLKSFFYLRDRVYFIFSGTGKICLANGLRELTRDVQMTSEF